MTQNQNDVAAQATLEALLDATLDDLEDMPEFVTPADGHYKCAIKWENKVVNSKPNVVCKLTFREVVELADPMEVAPKAGDSCDVMFNMTNEYGQGALKKILAPLASHFGVSSMREIFEASNDAEVDVVLKSKAGKKKPGDTEEPRKFVGIVSLTI